MSSTIRILNECSNVNFLGPPPGDRLPATTCLAPVPGLFAPLPLPPGEPGTKEPELEDEDVEAEGAKRTRPVTAAVGAGGNDVGGSASS